MRYEEAASQYELAQQPVKAAECLIKHALSQDAQKHSRASSTTTTMLSQARQLDATIPVLLKAQKLLEAHKSTRAAFDVSIL